MSLDLSKLEKVRELARGIMQARCPACAEGGHDRNGEHLRIYPDGRFGCCVSPKDKAHRKHIFALVGDKTPRGQFTVRVCGKLPVKSGSRSVKNSLREFLGTFRTPFSDSISSVPSVPGSLTDNLGTLGTGNSKSRALTRENEPIPVVHMLEQLKDWETAVPTVPTGERLPYLTPGGTLVIPFSSPERYHYWKPGQRLSPDETYAEVVKRMASATQSVETPEAEHGQADKEAQKQTRVEAPEGRLNPEHGDAHSHPNSEEERQKEQTDATNPF